MYIYINIYIYTCNECLQKILASFHSRGDTPWSELQRQLQAARVVVATCTGAGSALTSVEGDATDGKALFRVYPLTFAASFFHPTSSNMANKFLELH
jgi:hypothetical protein